MGSPWLVGRLSKGGVRPSKRRGIPALTPPNAHVCVFTMELHSKRANAYLSDVHEYCVAI